MLQDFSAFCAKIVGERDLLSVEFAAHANENVIRNASHIRFACLVEHSSCQALDELSAISASATLLCSSQSIAACWSQISRNTRSQILESSYASSVLR